MYVKTQKFLVLGISKSGFSVAKNIIANGGFCYIYEQLSNERINNAIEQLLQMGAVRVNDENEDACISLVDVLVISPGVPINHEIAVKAKRLGKRIIGELEYGYLSFTPPIVAVTGTNGKTTTVTYVDAMLNKAGIKSWLVGNVGTPLTERASEIDVNSVMVAEVSSFQLESINAFCPHVSCILNVSPDHLERHYSMENYIFLKKRIFKNQRESEYTVLNYDDKTVRGFFIDVKAKVVWVSLKEKVEGAYCLDGKLYYYDKFIIDESELKLKGEHNVYDALFAIVSAFLMGVDEQSVIDVLKNFKGVRHRIEHVCNKLGVDFYNDSKATNTASTICAINAMKGPVVLILGGSEKGERYEELFEKIKVGNVKHVVLTGASRFNMLDCAGKVGYSNISLTADFTHAVKIATMMAQSGDCVLLSPACASFDCFGGYQERGEAFCKIVENIKC